MQLICEDFDYDELSSELDNILLEDESPIKLIHDLDSDKKVKKESDKISDEVEDLLKSTDLIDKLENENEEDIDVNIDDTNKEDDIYLKLNNYSNTNNNDLDINVSDKNDNDIYLRVNDSINDKMDINVNDNSNKDMNININNSSNTSLLPNTNLFLNLKDSNTRLDKNDVNVILKSKDTTSSDINVKLNNPKSSDNTSTNKKNEVNVNLTNLDSNSDETKTDLFIKKRDELIEKANPNMKLSVCLKIIVDLKKSLNKLINYIPDETILVRTKYLLGDLIDSILESSDLLLKDDKKLKDMVYKVFDTVISINNYITDHYIKIEDKINAKDKESEDKQISNQLNTVDINKLDKELNNIVGISKDEYDSILNNVINKNGENSNIVTPNINRKKI